MESDFLNQENNFIFTNYISGIKGMPFDTTILLVNNGVDHTLDFIYNLTNQEQDNQTIKIPINGIADISSRTRVRMQNEESKVVDNTTKSLLFSAVVFGGNPLLQMAGSAGLDRLFGSLSNDYSKVDYQSYFEIRMKATIQNQEFSITLKTEVNPEEFIQKITNQNTE